MERVKSIAKFIFSSYQRTATVMFVGALLLAIPFTLSLLSKQQDIRQHASGVCANVAADMMLVIDKSTSMNDKDAIGSTTTLISRARDAAKSFVDAVSTNTSNKVGLVSYSSENQTTLDSPLTNTFSTVKDKIGAINASGETCTQCGIQKANAEITAHKTNGKNVVILLTDGKANAIASASGPTPTANPFFGWFGGPQATITNSSTAETAALNEVAKGVTANQTVYFTIGLGSSVNETFLKQIANASGGKYFSAPTADNLQSIYQQISQVVGKGAVSGYIYNDANKNGNFDSTEQKMSGWNLKLSPVSDSSQTAGNGLSDESGGFSISGVCDGDYNITATVPSQAWSFTSPVSGKYEVIITNGAAQTDKNFGVTNDQAPTITPTPNVTATPTTAATPTPSTIPTATPTGAPSETFINLNLQMVGIGSGAAALRLNNNPQRLSRNVDIKVFNANNVLISSPSSQVTFDQASGNYKGHISLGTNFTSGPYLVKARLDNTLWKTVPGIQNIVSGTTLDTPITALITGDLNQDNEINLLDYNIFISCYNNQCPTSPLTRADIDDMKFAFDIERKQN